MCSCATGTSGFSVMSMAKDSVGELYLAYGFLLRTGLVICYDIGINEPINVSLAHVATQFVPYREGEPLKTSKQDLQPRVLGDTRGRDETRRLLCTEQQIAQSCGARW